MASQPVALADRPSTTEIILDPGADGIYEFSVASIRKVGTREAESAPCPPVRVTADSVAPVAPSDLALTFQGGGIEATWLHSDFVPLSGELTFNLYRLPGTGPAVIEGQQPLKSGIAELKTADPAPSENDRNYAVTAVDAAGNESGPSNAVYLNVSLLPVQSLRAEASSSFTTLTWAHPRASGLTFEVNEISGPQPITLHTGSDLNAVVPPRDFGDRRYSVVAIDNTGARSEAHSLALPFVIVERPDAAPLVKGVFNNVSFRVSNKGALVLAQGLLRATIAGDTFTSQPFDLQPNGETAVSIIIPGAAKLTAAGNMTVELVHRPVPGDEVVLRSQLPYTTTNSLLPLSIETDKLLRGGSGRVRFTIENISAVQTEILTAQQSGNSPSPDVRLKFVDSEENVYTAVSLKQALGNSVINVSGGNSVARINALETWTSDWIDFPIPSGAPLQGTVRLEIDKFHYNLGTPGALTLDGGSTDLSVNLAELPYNGAIVSLTPETVLAGETVTITIEARTLNPVAPLAFSPLDIVLRNDSGLERVFQVATNDDGQFIFAHKTGANDSGAYKVSVVYPDSIDRPAQGSFVVGGLSVTPSEFRIKVPKNYQLSYDVTLRAAGLPLTNARLEYRADDQSLGLLPAGIGITLASPINLPAKGSQTVTLGFSAGPNAENTGFIRLRLMSDSTGPQALGFLTLPYELSTAAASLVVTPASAVVGAALDNATQRVFTVQNRGLAPLRSAQVKIVDKATKLITPNWITITTGALIEQLEVGAQRPIDISFRPLTGLAEGFHEFLLIVSDGSESPIEVPITVAVSRAGTGAVLVRAIDIYTGTLNALGQVVPGLAGARVKLVHDTINDRVFEGITDDRGEILFTGIPVGRYSVRGSAKGHNNSFDQVTVEPGVTSSLDLLIMNALISIEWSVREIALQDRYQIVLSSTFLTDVPVANIVLEPSGVNLPSLKKGEVFRGELTLTNHGLIDANNLKASFPSSNGKLKFEFFETVPATLAPKEQIVIPYRITALEDVDPDLEGQATGGGCAPESESYVVNGDSFCAAGITVPLGTSTIFMTSAGGPDCDPVLTPGLIGWSPPAEGGGVIISPGDPGFTIGCASLLPCGPTEDARPE